MRGSRDLSRILEALDRIQYYVTIYLGQVYDSVVGLNPLEKIRYRNLVLPAMTAESLGLHMISDEIDQYVTSASVTFPIATKSWDRNQLLRTTALSGLEPMSVYYWAQAAKTYVSQFVPSLDQGAQIYLTIEAQRDAIVAMEGATVVNRANVDGAFNWMLAPTLSLETRNRLLGNSKRFDLAPTDTLLQHLDAEPRWEVVRPRVKALGETIDTPRPVHLLTSDIFGIQSPDRAAVKTAIQEVLKIPPSNAKDFLDAIASFPPSLMSGSYKSKRFFSGFVPEAPKPAEQNKPSTPDVFKIVPPWLAKYGLLESTSFETDGENLSKADPTAFIPRRKRYDLPKPPFFGVDQSEPVEKVNPPELGSPPIIPGWADFKLPDSTSTFPSPLKSLSLEDPLQVWNWPYKAKGRSKK